VSDWVQLAAKLFQWRPEMEAPVPTPSSPKPVVFGMDISPAMGQPPAAEGAKPGAATAAAPTPMGGEVGAATPSSGSTTPSEASTAPCQTEDVVRSLVTLRRQTRLPENRFAAASGDSDIESGSESEEETAQMGGGPYPSPPAGPAVGRSPAPFILEPEPEETAAAGAHATAAVGAPAALPHGPGAMMPPGIRTVPPESVRDENIASPAIVHYRRAGGPTRAGQPTQPAFGRESQLTRAPERLKQRYQAGAAPGPQEAQGEPARRAAHAGAGAPTEGAVPAAGDRARRAEHRHHHRHTASFENVVNLVMASQRQLHEAEMSCREYGGGRVCSTHPSHTPRSEAARESEARKGGAGLAEAAVSQLGIAGKGGSAAADVGAGSPHLRQQQSEGSGQAQS